MTQKKKKKSEVARQTRILYFLIKISREFEWTIIFKIKWLINTQNLKYSHHCKNKQIQVLFKFHANSTAYGFLLFLFKKNSFSIIVVIVFLILHWHVLWAATAIRPYAAPPLIVIPMKDIHAYPQNSPLPPPSPPPVEIKTRGEEFWKGW